MPEIYLAGLIALENILREFREKAKGSVRFHNFLAGCTPRDILIGRESLFSSRTSFSRLERKDVLIFFCL